MPERRSLNPINLEKYGVYIVDKEPLSRYFNITELPNTFTGGKNGFLIQGSNELQNDTLVKIEIKDANGDVIYHTPGEGNPGYYEGTSKVISVWVYPETAFGPCTITVLGELIEYEDENGFIHPIPDEWRNRYNVRWQGKVNVRPFDKNVSKIRFARRPKIELTEEIREVSNVVETPIKIGTIDSTGTRRPNLYSGGTTPKYNYAEVFNQNISWDGDVWDPCADLDDYGNCVGGYINANTTIPKYYLQLPNTSSFTWQWGSEDDWYYYYRQGMYTSTIEDTMTRKVIADTGTPGNSGTIIPRVTKIGKEYWFNYNLELNVYNDGTIIPFASNDTEWNNYCSNAIGCYRYVNDTYVANQGFIYNWYAVNNSKGIGGLFTRIPTQSDWDDMIGTLGGYNKITLNKLRQRTDSGKWSATGDVRTDDGDTNNSGFSGSWYQYYSGEDTWDGTMLGWNNGAAYWGYGQQDAYDGGEEIGGIPVGILYSNNSDKNVYKIDGSNYGTSRLRTLYDGMFIRCIWQGSNYEDTLKKIDITNSNVTLKIKPENLTENKLYSALEYINDEYPLLDYGAIIRPDGLINNTGSIIRPILDNGTYRDAYTQWLSKTGKTYDIFSPKILRIIDRYSKILPDGNPFSMFPYLNGSTRSKHPYFKFGQRDQNNLSVDWLNDTAGFGNEPTPSGPLLAEIDSLYTWPTASHAYTTITGYVKGRPVYNTSYLEPQNWSVVGAEYGITSVSKSLYTSAVSTSVSTIRVSDLETFTGDATRLKLYYSSRSDNQSFKLLEDIQIESNELFYTSSFYTNPFNKEINVLTGQMINPVVLNEFWITSSLNCQVIPTLSTNTQIGSVVRLIPTSQSIDINSKYSDLYKFSYSYPISFSLSTEYQLDFNVYLGQSGSLSGYAKVEVYGSGSAFNTTNKNSYGKLLGTVEGTTDLLNHKFLTFDKQQYSFFPDKTGDGTISFIGYNTGIWEIGDLSLRASQESAFTPNEVTLVTQIPLEHNFETIDLRFELYDINNNKVPIDISAAYTLEGGNDVGRTTVIQENTTIYSQLSFGNNDPGSGDNITIVANGNLPYISFGQATDPPSVPGIGYNKPGIFIGAQNPAEKPSFSIKSNADHFLWDGDRLEIELTHLNVVSDGDVKIQNLTNAPTPVQHVVMYNTESKLLYMTASSATGGSGKGFPFSGSAEISGSLLVSSSTNPLTLKGLQPGVSTYYLVADTVTGLISYNTAVLGAGFPYTGQAVISGSLDISGSSRVSGTIYLTGSFSSSGDIMVYSHRFGRGPSDKITNIVMGASASFSASTSTNALESEYNTSIGFQAGMHQTLGINNTFIGANAGLNATGSTNNFIGAFSAYELIAGDGNTFIGAGSGRYVDVSETTFNTEANNSVFIGQNVKAGAIQRKNQIAIGQRSVALGTNTITLGNDNSKMFAIPYGVGVFGAVTTPNYGSKTKYEQLYVSASASINAMVIEGANNNYTQLNIKNTFAGISSSADFVATNNIGNEDQYYVNMGINNSSYGLPNSIGSANDAYLYNTGSNLWIGNATPSNYVNSNINFFAGNPGTTVHMFIKGDGKVGIGNTSPGYKLDVSGDINFTGTLYKNGVQFTSGVGGTGLSGRLTKWDSAGTALTYGECIKESAGVGIQFGNIALTPDPGTIAYYYVSVAQAGSNTYVDTGETTTVLQHTNNTITSNNPGIGPPITFSSKKNSAKFGTINDSNVGFSGHLDIVTNDISRIFITSGSNTNSTGIGGGNVGIGNNMGISQFNTTNPPKLFVSGSGSYNAMVVTNIKDGYSQFNIVNSSAGTLASTDIVATANIGSETQYYIDMGINNSNYNVTDFIGTANEAYLYNTGSNLWIGNATPGINGNIKFFAGNTGTTASFFISSSGEVGLNTINPRYKFEVSGTTRFNGNSLIDSPSNPSLTINNTGTAAGNGIPSIKLQSGMNQLSNTGTQIARIVAVDDSSTTLGDIIFSKGAVGGGGSDLILNLNGRNVGIGTQLPSSKLDVNGNIKTRTLNISSSVSISPNVFIDDFQTALNNTIYTSGGSPTMNYIFAASSSAGTGLGSLKGNIYTNGATTQTGVQLQSSVTTGFNRLYSMGNYTTIGSTLNTQMCLNPGLLEWTFNAKTNFSASGFDSTVTAGQYDYGRQGIACVLACDNINPYDSTAKGYALTYGNLMDTDPLPIWSLSKFTGGLRANSNITPIISNSLAAFSNGRANTYTGHRVTYNSITGQWSAYSILSGTPAGLFADPKAATNSWTGNGRVDITYQSASLANFGMYTNVTSSNATALYDNIGLYYYPSDTTGLNIQTGSMVQYNGSTILVNLSTLNAANDSAAAALGVPVFGLYRNGNTIQIRMQ